MTDIKYYNFYDFKLLYYYIFKITYLDSNLRIMRAKRPEIESIEAFIFVLEKS